MPDIMSTYEFAEGIDQMLQGENLPDGHAICAFHGVSPVVDSATGKPTVVKVRRLVEMPNHSQRWVEVETLSAEGLCLGCYEELKSGQFIECGSCGIQPKAEEDGRTVCAACGRVQEEAAAGLVPSRDEVARAEQEDAHLDFREDEGGAVPGAGGEPLERVVADADGDAAADPVRPGGSDRSAAEGAAPAGGDAHGMAARRGAAAASPKPAGDGGPAAKARKA